jgi:hypothetical protein
LDKTEEWGTIKFGAITWKEEMVMKNDLGTISFAYHVIAPYRIVLSSCTCYPLPYLYEGFQHPSSTKKKKKKNINPEDGNCNVFQNVW